MLPWYTVPSISILSLRVWATLHHSHSHIYFHSKSLTLHWWFWFVTQPLAWHWWHCNTDCDSEGAGAHQSTSSAALSSAHPALVTSHQSPHTLGTLGHVTRGQEWWADTSHHPPLCHNTPHYDLITWDDVTVIVSRSHYCLPGWCVASSLPPAAASPAHCGQDSGSRSREKAVKAAGAGRGLAWWDWGSGDSRGLRDRGLGPLLHWHLVRATDMIPVTTIHTCVM